ncbi:MAG: iron-containing alcohol dehydrogenase [Bacillus sp. (in: firmicutes)]
MKNTAYRNPTKVIFGKESIASLADEVKQYGKKVLVVYGGGSIKKNGIYEHVMQELKKIDASVYELSGVEPNPRITTVRKGVEICRQEQIDLLLAVGGGSVIDCTKAIAAGANYEGDPWDIVRRKVVITEALPIGTVLTIAATGSEMNGSSVITNWETKEKYGWGGPAVYPKFSILDPSYTFSVPLDQTIYGIVDMMSHVFEQYFHHIDNTPLQDRMCESVLKTVIETGPKLIKDLHNYELRETILYSGTIALNGTLSFGIQGDWATHNIEHAVSAVHDIPHAGGLAILFPNWMEHTLHERISRYVQLAVRVWRVNPEGKTDEGIAREGIAKLREFWNGLGAPSTLGDYGIKEDSIDLIADKAMANGPFGQFSKLERQDVLTILQASL